MRIDYVFLLVMAGFLCLFLRLTRSSELQSKRWIQIGASLVLLWVLLSLVFEIHNLMRTRQAAGSIQVLSLLLPSFAIVVALGFIWGPIISHHIADRVIKYLYEGSIDGSLGGFRPDFHAARSFMKDENWKSALEAAEQELTKDPDNYEGHMLIAAILQRQQCFAEAIQHLDRLLKNPSVEQQQKEFAQQARTNCLAQNAEAIVMPYTGPGEPIYRRVPQAPSETVELDQVARIREFAQQLEQAAEEGNNEVISDLLERCPELGPEHLDPALFQAARNGRQHTLQHLLARSGARIEGYDRLRALLCNAAYSGNEPLVAWLLSEIGNPPYLPTLLNEALQCADSTNPQMIQCLVDGGGALDQAIANLRRLRPPRREEAEALERKLDRLSRINEAQSSRNLSKP